MFLTFLAALSACSGTPLPGDSSVQVRPIVSDFLFLDDSTILLSSWDGLFRSDDKGATWARAATLPDDDLHFAFVVRRLTMGSNGSIWGVMDTVLDKPLDWLQIDYPYPHGLIGISDDRGATIQTFPGDEFYGLADVIERANQDPLLLDYSGKFWTLTRAPNGKTGTMQQWGESIPNYHSVSAALCDGQLFVRGSNNTQVGRTSSLWKTTDSAATWTELISFSVEDHPLDLTCGPGGKLAVRTADHKIILLDQHSGDELSRVSLDFYPTQLLWYDAHILTVGEDAERSVHLARVSLDGTVETLPALPPDCDTRLRVDSEGAIWAGGCGLFRLHEDATTWEQLWPPEDSTR